MALRAGTISEPGYPASAMRRSKPSLASNGTKRKSPATREWSVRPGVRFSSRQSATSGGSGRGRSWPVPASGGRPRPSGRKRGS